MPLTNRPQSDDDVPPPPSYDDAIKDTLVEETSSSIDHGPPLPQRRQTQRRPPPSLSPSPPPLHPSLSPVTHLNVPYDRPPERRTTSSTSAISSSSSRRSNESQFKSSDLYTNNTNLPFSYTRGYYCKKCKNSGYKSPKQICRACWDRFYLKDHAYNPNQKNLPFSYPKRFYCLKCGNTGYKFKNGLTCQNCWSQFGPRNNSSYVNSAYQPSFFGSTTYISAPGGGFNNGVPARRVPPGSPELGGLLCGNCRGEGMIHILFDTDLCPVCGGLGRVFPRGTVGTSSAPPPPQPPRPPQMNYGYPPPQPGPPPQGPPPLQQWGGYQYDYNYGAKN